MAGLAGEWPAPAAGRPAPPARSGSSWLPEGHDPHVAGVDVELAVVVGDLVVHGPPRDDGVIVWPAGVDGDRVVVVVRHPAGGDVTLTGGNRVGQRREGRQGDGGRVGGGFGKRAAVHRDGGKARLRRDDRPAAEPGRAPGAGRVVEPSHLPSV